MIRRPPRSPLFPYTPLSRSYSRETRNKPFPTFCFAGLRRSVPPADEFQSLSINPELGTGCTPSAGMRDRKSTRLNSSHSQISYAVFCLKKKKTEERLFLP